MGAGTKLPREGKVFLTVKNHDKQRAVKIARDLVAQGFEILQPKAQRLPLLQKALQFRPLTKSQKDARTLWT